MEERKETVSVVLLKGAKTPDKSSDYYFENGYVVFTEAYHLKRGYCCKSGCRHCPYGCKKTPGDGV